MRKSLKKEVCAWIALVAAPHAFGQDSPARRLLEATEADQITFVKSALDQGMPPDMGGRMGLLLLNRSSLALPLLEAKVEQVLKSDNPPACFTDNFCGSPPVCRSHCLDNRERW